MSLEAQDSPTTRTTCRFLILLFIVISVQATGYPFSSQHKPSRMYAKVVISPALLSPVIPFLSDLLDIGSKFNRNEFYRSLSFFQVKEFLSSSSPSTGKWKHFSSSFIISFKVKFQWNWNDRLWKKKRKTYKQANISWLSNCLAYLFSFRYKSTSVEIYCRFCYFFLWSLTFFKISFVYSMSQIRCRIHKRDSFFCFNSSTPKRFWVRAFSLVAQLYSNSCLVY